MKVILCVTNDIVTDQRVGRIAVSLMKIYSRVTVIGRIRKGQMNVNGLPFQTYRIRLLFNKGPLFYAEYNLRVLFYLLFSSADILVANDLDTLLSVYLASRLRNRPMLYDSHEYFTEVPELIGRHFKKRIWQLLERFILPKLNYAYTVSNSISNAYNSEYGIDMEVIRNVPIRLKGNIQPERLLRTGIEKIILYQGSLNMGRGLELAINAVQYMRDTKLIIIGTGDIEYELRELATRLGIQERIVFTGRIPQNELFQYTIQADLAISLEQKTGLSYYYALPNKLFDYIQAEVPVVVSEFPEMAAVVRHYDIGMATSLVDPKELAGLFNEMLNNNQNRKKWKSNLKKAAEELCWEKEEHKLLGLYRNAAGTDC